MLPTDDRERVALIALLRNRPGGSSWTQLTSEVAEAGTALGVWDGLFGPSLFPPSAFADAEGELLAWRRSGERFISILDPEYPDQLRDIVQAPPFLFARGQVIAEDRAVSIVGSRSASRQGLEVASHLATALVEHGITVLSGLAAGIDAAAHRAALAVGGRTVAVVGTGIDRTYPAAHRELQEQISSTGLVLSQFWPGTLPTRQTFPMRNAVLSGYGFASVIVEAGEESGARIQARLAVEHGRPVVLTEAVVNTTDWAKRLVGRPGVTVAGSTSDVLSVLQDVGRRTAHLSSMLDELARAAQ